MALLNGFVLALYPACIHIFRLPEDFGGHSVGRYTEHVTTLPFSNRMASGQILYCSHTGTQTDVHVLLEGFDAMLGYASLSTNLTQEDVTFSLKDHLVHYDVEDGLWLNRRSYFYAPGAMGKVIFSCAPSGFPQKRPHLFWRILDTSGGADSREEPVINCESIPIDSSDLPVLHLLSCADFDDGRGILALGTIVGDVCIASISPECIITPGSILEMPNASEPILIQIGLSEVRFSSVLTLLFTQYEHSSHCR